MRSSGAPPVEIPLARFEPQFLHLRRELRDSIGGEPAERKRRTHFDHPRIAESRGLAARQHRNGTAGNARTPRGRLRRSRIHLEHFLDRPDSRDRILGVRERQRHRADQLPIDINRASAHTLHHAGMFQRTAGEPPENKILLRTGVLQHAENLHLKIFHLVAAENGLPHAAHACPDVLQRHDG